ncbi:MAG: hypothetical protein U0P45_03340 [Acidimicrobiales bacterium]
MAKEADSNEGLAGFLKGLEKYIDELVTVEVITMVDDVTVEIDAEGTWKVTHAPKKAVPAYLTRLNLASGDIKNVVPKSLEDDAGLREFHVAQVERGAAILPKNLKTLAEAAREILK